MIKIITLTLAFMAAASQAHALDFNYMADAGGMAVSGTIYGLQDDATSVPTDMTVTSYPTSLLDAATTYGPTIDMAGWLIGDGYNFTVQHGSITAALSDLLDPASPGAEVFLVYHQIDPLFSGITNAACIQLDVANGGPSGCIVGGADFVTFSAVSDVPEPAAAAILGVSFIAVVALRRRCAASLAG